MENKLCPGCQEVKPLDQFYLHRGKPESRCKPCFRKQQAEYKKRPPRHQTPPGTKRCTLCKETKPADQFHANKNFHDGRDRVCVGCTRQRGKDWAASHPGYSAAQLRKARAKDPDRFRDYLLKVKYGIPVGSYATMSERQGGRCAICGGTDPKQNSSGRLAVDHDAETGQVRGLLCGSCNNGLGRFRHSEERLLAAIEYLRSYPKEPELETVDSILHPN